MIIEKTYQFIDRLFTGTGWSRLGPAASRTAITSKGQARPGKNARNSSTAEAAGPARDAPGSDAPKER